MSKNNPSAGQVFKSPTLLLAFGFGSGLSPKAPGTFGTLVGVLIFYWAGQLEPMVFSGFLLLTILIGIYLCGEAAKTLGVHDHGGIVWDEMVGYWLTMMFLPATWQWMLAGFLLFRLFDITKPWPISWVDKNVHGGWGIMLDDMLAALMSWLILMAVYQWVS